MKNWILIILIMSINTASFSQGDSLGNQKWQTQHSIGVELGGKLIYYSLFYEFGVNKNKHNYSIGYGLNFYKTHITPVQGNMLFIKYYYGLRHNITFEISQSILIQNEGFNDNFQGNIWEKPQPFNKFNSISLGYKYNFKIPIAIFFNTMLNYAYGYKYDYSGNKINYTIIKPSIASGLIYKL